MTINRRDLLIAGTGIAGGMLLPKGLRQELTEAAGAPPIDRRALVDRHSPIVKALDPFAALTVGNGTFAFTADITGLQTFLDPYREDFPLCTGANWAWHTIPAPPGLRAEDFKYKPFDVHGRAVGYDTDSKGQQVLFDWLRQNPHRLHLGRIGLLLKKADGSIATPADLSEIDQRLDLWTGQLTSKFTFADQEVTVRTAVHPSQDALAIRITSPLLKADRIGLQIAFPYGSPEVDMADWKSPDKHQSSLKVTDNTAEISRTLDADHYIVKLAYSSGVFQHSAPHEFLLRCDQPQLETVLRFSPTSINDALPTVDETLKASADHWEKFWSTGGAIDLSQCTDDRAHELERRIVLSQYNTALHCAGEMPPPETGLLFNSWYGKSHLEMHWWHGVHFACWGRFDLFARSLDWYGRIFPAAKQIAQRQGYDGVRWPKMVGPDGHDSPSPVGPLLIWQQPHPIYYAELCYRQSSNAKILEAWREIVLETANFMASYAFLDHDRYTLGPPMKTVSENADTHTTTNPAFELTYWRFGLRIAQEWRKRLGLSPDPKWADVLNRLAPAPSQDKLYLMQEGMTDTYTNWNWEHPALLGCLGMLPGDGIDPAIMRNTLKKVMEVWQWDKCWGWDFPMAAMTAARLGEGELAVRALLIDTPKNRYHPNGHVYQRPKLTAYLPANGGLLSAIALMAATPGGFPRDGKWNVKAEELTPLL